MVPLPLLKVHVVVEQFAWLADSWNVFVPTVAPKETPFVRLNPAGVPEASVPPLYAELAAKYDS